MPDQTAVLDGETVTTTTDEVALGETPEQSTVAEGGGDDSGEPSYTLSDGTQVSLSELEKGYFRQSDYTRKTQEVAQARAEAAQGLQLLQALTDDPAATLEALQRQLLDSTDNEDLDPIERQVREHDQRFQAIEQQRFEQELDGMLGDLESRYDGVDRSAVLDWAIQNEIPNLEAAFLHMNAHQSADQERQAGNAAALARKRTAPPVGGRSRSLGGDAPQFKEVKNLDDAFANALMELDIQDW